LGSGSSTSITAQTLRIAPTCCYSPYSAQYVESGSIPRLFRTRGASRARVSANRRPDPLAKVFKFPAIAPVSRGGRSRPGKMAYPSKRARLTHLALSSGFPAHHPRQGIQTVGITT
jgi:hypothetical protein